MNTEPPPFLQALGLDTQADAKAVRRAYAQRLKAIDPAQDPQAFQALREAYEAAQRWLWVQAQQDSAAEAAPPAPEVAPAAEAPEAPPPPAPEPVFEAFAARAAAGFADEAAARTALESALADDRLVNLEARTLFEWNVGCLLMNGWQRGHEFLFAPACDLLGWEHDRRRLSLFGQLGAAMDRAIDERLIFFRQSPPEFEAQRRLIRRLRDDTAPSDAEVAADMPLLHALAQRYPTWLRAVTSAQNFHLWQARFEQLPPARRTADRPHAPVRPTPFERTKSSTRPWVGLLFLVVVLGGLAQLLGPRAPRPTPHLASSWAQPEHSRPAVAAPLWPMQAPESHFTLLPPPTPGPRSTAKRSTAPVPASAPSPSPAALEAAPLLAPLPTDWPAERSTPASAPAPARRPAERPAERSPYDLLYQLPTPASAPKFGP